MQGRKVAAAFILVFTYSLMHFGETQIEYKFNGIAVNFISNRDHL